MKNLIRSKKEQIREHEAETGRKIHEIASLEQSFPVKPIDSTSNRLYQVTFAGPAAIHAQTIHAQTMNAVLQQPAYLEILEYREVQPFFSIL